MAFSCEGVKSVSCAYTLSFNSRDDKQHLKNYFSWKLQLLLSTDSFSPLSQYIVQYPNLLSLICREDFNTDQKIWNYTLTSY